MRAQEKRLFDRVGHRFSNQVESFDMSKVQIVSQHVDTFKQYYFGDTSNLYLVIKEQFETIGSGFILKLLGHDFAVSKMSKVSGYRYKLQNNPLGLIILLGSYYQKEELNGIEKAHNVKIECSAHYLEDKPSKLVTNDLRAFANELLTDFHEAGVSPHLAVDVQGWKIPDDFHKRFVTRIHRKMQVTGVDSMEFVGRACAFTFGAQETVMIGSASGQQLCIYDKTRELDHSKKGEYWRSRWLNTSDEYDINEDVTRVEWRLSKTILNQFSSVEKDMKINNYSDTVDNLNSIWLYCVLKNRLHHSSRFVDPFWQIMIEDVCFNDCEVFEVKRVYAKQKALRGEGGRAPDTTRNMLMALGNIITIYAAKGLTDIEIISSIRSCGFWSDLGWYYLFKNSWGDQQIEEMICQRVKYRRLVA